MGLTDRGQLTPGMHADITVINPVELVDTATFQDPHQHAKGVEYVLVNGRLVVVEGEYTGELAGKTLRYRAR